MSKPGFFCPRSISLTVILISLFLATASWAQQTPRPQSIPVPSDALPADHLTHYADLAVQWMQ